MPDWLQIILAIAAALTALGVIWAKGVRPLARLIHVVDEMTPVLVDLTETFKDAPGAFARISSIQAQFKTDHGTSLRDIVNDLDTAAKVNATAAEVLKVQVEASRLLDDQDRAQVQRLIILLDRLTIKVEALDEAGAKAVALTSQVAADLAVAKEKVEGVAADLLASHDRASVIGQRPETEAGAAADAAAAHPVGEQEHE